MEDKQRMIVFLLISLFLVSLINSVIGLYNVYSIKRECKDSYGFGSAIHLFKEQCESKGMLFAYVTQGKFLRCFNETTTVFYDFNFEYKDKLENE